MKVNIASCSICYPVVMIVLSKYYDLVAKIEKHLAIDFTKKYLKNERKKEEVVDLADDWVYVDSKNEVSKGRTLERSRKGSKSIGKYRTKHPSRRKSNRPTSNNRSIQSKTHKGKRKDNTTNSGYISGNELQEWHAGLNSSTQVNIDFSRRIHSSVTRGVQEWLDDIHILTGGKDIGVVIDVSTYAKTIEHFVEVYPDASHNLACYKNGVIGVPTDERWEDELKSSEIDTDEIPEFVGNTPAHHMSHEYGHFLSEGGINREKIAPGETSYEKIEQLFDNEEKYIEFGLLSENELDEWMYGLSCCSIKPDGGIKMKELYAETVSAIMTDTRTTCIPDCVMYFIFKDMEVNTPIIFPDGHSVTLLRNVVYDVVKSKMKNIGKIGMN